MSLKRLRAGELLALVGAGSVVVSLLVPWYESPTGTLDAWSTFGPAVALLMVAALVALALVAGAVTERGTAIPVAAGVWSVVFGLVAVIVALVRLLERPDHATSLCSGPWLALAGAVTILAGSWQSLRDEHRSLYEPAAPPPRSPPAQ